MKKDYIFGYGSLILEESRKKTGATGKSLVVIVNGFRRAWNVLISKSKTIALGLEKSKRNSCNGIIFEVPEKELIKFDKREGSSYKRVKLPLENIKFLSKRNFDGGKVWVYITRKKARPSKDFKIQQSYIDVILTGCLEIDLNFAKEFIKTTSNWKSIENDRKNPKYPRALDKLQFKKEIDRLMKKLKCNQ